jgi:hypothetical protein
VYNWWLQPATVNATASNPMVMEETRLIVPSSCLMTIERSRSFRFLRLIEIGSKINPRRTCLDVD